jgi:hypothetical protein
VARAACCPRHRRGRARSLNSKGKGEVTS